jgi:hypothetical protein
VAADVNKDGAVNIADVAILNRIVLEMINEFPNNTSYRFLPKKLEISSNPLKVDWPGYIDMSEPNLDYKSLDFVSIKVGDVNNSALALNSELESRDVQTLSIPDTFLSFKSNMNIPVKYTGTEKITALTMKIKYDKRIIKFVKIESTNMPGFGAQHYNEKDGAIIISYDHPQGLDFSPTDVLMNIVFDNVTSMGLSKLDVSDVLFLNKNFAEIAVTAKNGSINYVNSLVPHLPSTARVHSYPNPFNEVWNIDIQLTTPDKIKLEIMDIAGRLLKEITSNQISNTHRIQINDLDYHGLVHAKITSNKETFTFRAFKM